MLQIPSNPLLIIIFRNSSLEAMDNAPLLHNLYPCYQTPFAPLFDHLAMPTHSQYNPYYPLCLNPWNFNQEQTYHGKVKPSANKTGPDHQNTANNSEFEGSHSPSKGETDRVTALSETQNSLPCESSLGETEEIDQQSQDKLDKTVSFTDFYNSQRLNPTCSKCSSRLLDGDSRQNWVQCSGCLGIVHSQCQITGSTGQYSEIICCNCRDSSRPSKNHPSVKPSKKIRKSKCSRPKAFKSKSETFLYLDSFLNGFSYRLGLSQDQIRKDIARAHRGS